MTIKKYVISPIPSIMFVSIPYLVLHPNLVGADALFAPDPSLQPVQVDDEFRRCCELPGALRVEIGEPPRLGRFTFLAVDPKVGASVKKQSEPHAQHKGLHAPVNLLVS